MTPDQLTTEQHELRAATQRLLDGSPQRSNGKLTVAGLAAESGIPRHRLYEHHADLVAEFQTAANGGPTPPNIQALQHQLANALTREQQLIVVNNALAASAR
jgi:hypothetical protein